MAVVSQPSLACTSRTFAVPGLALALSIQHPSLSALACEKLGHTIWPALTPPRTSHSGTLSTSMIKVGQPRHEAHVKVSAFRDSSHGAATTGSDPAWYSTSLALTEASLFGDGSRLPRQGGPKLEILRDRHRRGSFAAVGGAYCFARSSSSSSSRLAAPFSRSSSQGQHQQRV